MKSFKLKKIKGQYDYSLEIQQDCYSSPRGNKHCSTGGQYVFLTQEDLDNLIKTIVGVL